MNNISNFTLSAVSGSARDATFPSKERHAARRCLRIRTVTITPSGDQFRSIVPLSWLARTRLTIFEP